jgi:hypothetical protein
MNNTRSRPPVPYNRKQAVPPGKPSPVQFVYDWELAATLAEFCAKHRMSPRSASARASYYRKTLVPKLKTFPRGPAKGPVTSRERLRRELQATLDSARARQATAGDDDED